MSTPSISVIMLTYNRESMVSQAIESILQQTFVDFEFILVDNGSTDQSGEICKKYALNDRRIRVIHQKKGNIGSGRNFGLDIASGRYVTFIDDDDYAYPDMLEFLYNLAIENDAEIAVCGSHKMEDKKLFPNIIYDNTYIMDSIEATKAYLYRRLYNAAMPTKLFHKSMFDKIRFSNSGHYDDIVTSYRYFVHAKKVAACGLPKYCFCRHPGNNSSAATKFEMLNPEQLQEYLAAFRERTSYINTHLPCLKEFAQYSEWSYMVSMCNKIKCYERDNCLDVYQQMRKELIAHWNEFYRGIYIVDFEKKWMEELAKEKN